MKSKLCLLAALFAVVLNFSAAASAADIVADGVPRGQIVIAAERPRMATLAALELQYYIERISGARLPIVTERDATLGAALYVGESSATRELGVSVDGLEYGAYRIASGDDWVAFVGDDYDYSPPHPSPELRRDVPAAQEEWDAITSKATDHAWGFPFGNSFKHRWRPRSRGDLGNNPMATLYGEENEALWPDGDFKTGFWVQDEGGSLNAVYAWLRDLGVRWYAPEDIGEVVPQMATIELPDINVTVEPDYKMRAWTWYNYSGFRYTDVIWGRRLGLNSSYPLLGNLGYAHGHVLVHKRDEMKQAHPEYYALFKGERDVDHRGYGRACYSSEGLFQETVAYARFLFDQYDEPHVSIWPSDGFRKCQCEDCADKTPSELVWEFTDRVARELYKTHPDRLVSGGAYTPYNAPPDSIEQFSPNVAVFVSNEGRPAMTDPDHWQLYNDRIEAWNSRLAPGRILRVENNRYSLFSGGEYDVFPVPQGRAMARDLKAMRGIVIGEHSEQSQQRLQIVNPAMTHWPLYVQSRFFWDAQQDYDALADEYYRLYYGPAAADVQAAMDFAEEAFLRAYRTAPAGARATNPANVPLTERIQFIEMLLEAKQTAGDTQYAERVQMLIDGLQPLDEVRAELAAERAGRTRGDVPQVVGITADSAADAKAYELRRNSGHPDSTASARFAWDGKALIIDVRCEDPDVDNLSIVPDVRASEAVVIQIETPGLSWYQIEVTPTGEIYDADFGGGEGERWSSLAEVDTEIGADFWRVVVRLPVVDGASGSSDPMHQIAGAKPTEDSPWYINVGRRIISRENTRRGRGAASTLQLSPSREPNFGLPDTFARFVIAD